MRSSGRIVFCFNRQQRGGFGGLRSREGWLGFELFENALKPVLIVLLLVAVSRHRVLILRLML